MARISERNIYDFDVAVSFAGEDRELAEDVVNRLRVAGLTVFCDTDCIPAMWGGELLEDLDPVYCSRARAIVVFVSYPYSKKMWTRHQRRSALTRALEQAHSHVLLARLDNTRLKGLRPATGYLDARRIGLGGVAQAAIAKLTGIQASTSAIDHVPRTEIERQQVLHDRPLGWEYLYFAGQLRHERDRIEAKYRDHELRYPWRTGIEVSHGDIRGYLARASQEASHLSQTLTQMMSPAAQARAFGAPGQPGDPDRLFHLAKRWNSVYEQLMDWAADLRAVRAMPEYSKALELLARYADGPVERYREFVDSLVTMVDKLPAAVATGKTIRLELTLVLSIPDEVYDAFMAELDRLSKPRAVGY
jgi:hypothetical protein